MAKANEVPEELGEFNRIFERLVYMHDASQVFIDFLDLFIKQFTFDDCTELNELIQKRYTQEERFHFGDLIKEAILVMDKQLKGEDDWYDVFGAYYEVLASSYKRSGFGQFFTPASVVDLMVQIQGVSGKLKGKGVLVGDPACGSGRTLIAFQAYNPGNFLVGQDIDLVCCKMTIMNMILHGCKGEVVWGNSLNPEDIRRAWRIVPFITGIPQVYEIEKSESFTWQVWDEKRQDVARGKKELIIKDASNPKQPIQLELNFL